MLRRNREHANSKKDACQIAGPQIASSGAAFYRLRIRWSRSQAARSAYSLSVRTHRPVAGQRSIVINLLQLLGKTGIVFVAELSFELRQRRAFPAGRRPPVRMPTSKTRAPTTPSEFASPARRGEQGTRAIGGQIAEAKAAERSASLSSLAMPAAAPLGVRARSLQDG